VNEDENESTGHEPWTVEDFRIHTATSLAIEEIKKLSPPETKKELRKCKQEVAKVVGREIGETPRDALKEYIMPEVFIPWEVGLILEEGFEDVFESLDDMFERVSYSDEPEQPGHKQHVILRSKDTR